MISSPFKIYFHVMSLCLGPEEFEPRNKRYFLDDDREIVIRKVEEMEGSFCESRLDAEVVVCDSILAASQRNLLAMALKGGAVMSSSYLTNGQGSIVVFKNLLRTPKWLLITDRFMKEAPGFAKVIIGIVRRQKAPRLWKIMKFDELMARSSGQSVG